MDKRIGMLIAVLLMLPTVMAAQHDDVGLWLEAGATKKLNKQWSLGVGAEYRLRNDLKTSDRMSLDLEAGFKPVKHLELGAGYSLLMDNNRESTSYHSDGTANEWTPSYWGTRHRFYLEAQGDVDLGRMNVSLRERWQYTYRPEVSGKTYDADNNGWEAVKGKGKHLLRSKLKLEYNIPHSKIDPFASAELFHGKGGLQKSRYLIGGNWKLSKMHAVSLYYGYQKLHGNDDDNEPNTHLIGVSYKFKF